jgi:hypothetical protein
MAKPKMRALSIRQPYPEQILTGQKRIEYRTRPTHIRGRVYIYASRKPGDQTDFAADGYTRDDLPRGVLVGTVEIVNCTEGDGDFQWHLANPKRLRTPLVVEGMPQPGSSGRLGVDRPSPLLPGLGLITPAIPGLCPVTSQAGQEEGAVPAHRK